MSKVSGIGSTVSGWCTSIKNNVNEFRSLTAWNKVKKIMTVALRVIAYIALAAAAALTLACVFGAKLKITFPPNISNWLPSRLRP